MGERERERVKIRAKTDSRQHCFTTESDHLVDASIPLSHFASRILILEISLNWEGGKVLKGVSVISNCL